MYKFSSTAVAWVVLAGTAFTSGGNGVQAGRPAGGGGGIGRVSGGHGGSMPASRPSAPRVSQSTPAAPRSMPSFSRGGSASPMRQASPSASSPRSAQSVPKSSPAPSHSSVGRSNSRSSAPVAPPITAPSFTQQRSSASRSGGGASTTRPGFRSEAPEVSRHDRSNVHSGIGDLRDDLPSRQIERGTHGGGLVARVPEAGRSGGSGAASRAGESWRDVRNHEIAQRQPVPASFGAERGRVSTPESSPGFARGGANGRIPALERLPRQMPQQGSVTRPDAIAPNAGNSALSGAIHTESWSSSSSHFHSSFELNVAFSNSCNHFSCWNGFNGCHSGFFFCGDCLFWFWCRPGCAPCYWPYNYYYWPSCYYLPAYYPVYSDVRVVHEYVDDGSYYPQLSEQSAPAKEADAAALAGRGWDLFRSRDYGGAADSFRQAVLANPDDAATKLAYAQSLFAIGDYADSAFLLRRALELQPDLPALGEDPRLRYGEAEDHGEQMLALRTFLDHVKGDPAATLVLGWQSYFTGDLSVARESFDALKALDSEDAAAKRFLERLGPAPAPGH
jgi:hypothetical protein